MSDTPTLVRFFTGWEQEGMGPDGLPMFRQVVRIRLDRPPYLSLERVATDEDINDHPKPYELYQKVEKARSDMTGYPLSMWPACLPHIFQMCAARDIHTVEQLAQLVSKKRRSETVKQVPPEVVEVADRAARLIEMQGKSGQYEAIVTDLEGQLAAVREQLTEALTTISAQKTLIDNLKVKMVA